MMENRCVSCGNIIPEGRQTCPKCLGDTNYSATQEKKLAKSVGKENQKSINKLFDYIEGILSFLGFEVETIVIRDKYSHHRYEYEKQ